MGSKRAMLTNGLGKVLRAEARSATRVVDLFTGSGAVARWAAENTGREVLAVDLQHYGAVLAQGVIGRDAPADATALIRRWLRPAAARAKQQPMWAALDEHMYRGGLTPQRIQAIRAWCEASAEIGVVWGAYGGHYFSPYHALLIDELIAGLPKKEPLRSLCLAALLEAASDCAAAPGHTAQPLQPITTVGFQSILSHWYNDLEELTRQALRDLAPRHAAIAGSTIVGDALEVAATELRPGDLVFCDPPYSSDQYSRFYHVLETIARSKAPDQVSGVGRMPTRAERPVSDFSSRHQSLAAFTELFASVAAAGARIVLTFPKTQSGNGVSGESLVALARKHFDVTRTTVDGEFSTLGGTGRSRSARTPSKEIIARMRPRTTARRRPPRWIDIAAEVLTAAAQELGPDAELTAEQIVAWSVERGPQRPDHGQTPARSVNRALHEALRIHDPRIARGAEPGTFRIAGEDDHVGRRAKPAAPPAPPAAPPAEPVTHRRAQLRVVPTPTDAPAEDDPPASAASAVAVGE